MQKKMVFLSISFLHVNILEGLKFSTEQMGQISEVHLHKYIPKHATM
jgi:hypothetical protein